MTLTGPHAGIHMTGSPPRWETSSFGDAADTKPADLATLGEHTAQCSTDSGHLVGVQMAAGRMAGFLWAHLVTSLAALIALAGALLLWL